MRHYMLAALLALAGTSTALAQNDSGLYIGAGAGQFNVEIDDVNTANNIQDTFDSDDTVFKLFAGWRFNPFFGVELDYVDLGAPEDTVGTTSIETKISGVAPYLIGTLPLGPIELFAKAGYYFYDVEVNGRNIVSVDDSGENLVYGLGAGVTLFEHLHARLEYEIIDVSEVDDANVFWISAAWRF